MKKTSHIENAKSQIEKIQWFTDQANHTFQWSRGTATCACGCWTLWGASLKSAKRSHAYHRANLPEEQRAVGGRDRAEPALNELIPVEEKGSAANAAAHVS